MNTVTHNRVDVAVNDFIECLEEQSRSYFTYEEANDIAEEIGLSAPVIVIKRLKNKGLKLTNTF